MLAKLMCCLVGFSFIISQQVFASDKKTIPKGKVEPPTRVVMDGIFDPLTKVLPLSYDAAEFESPANRAKIKADLKSLSENSSRLREHAKGKDRTFEFIAASLTRDAKDIYRWYARGSYSEARYLLHNLTENCIACHSRLPETYKFPAAENFFKKVQPANLSLAEKAQLQMSTRQFDAALDSYEQLFASQTSKPADFVMMDTFADYLKLNIRVKEDFKRPIPVMEKLSKREDVPKFVALEVAQWLKDLKQLASNPPVGANDLVIGRSLIEKAQKRMQFRMDRAGLVEYITASRFLNKFITSKAQSVNSTSDDAEVAEAYYLLGITESMVGRSYWLSQMEFYLETAVRLAPKSAFAEKAYALLEEQTVLEFSGSAGTNVPEDVQQTLRELRKLIHGGN